MPKSVKPVQNPGVYLTNLFDKHNLNPFKVSKEIHLSQSAVRLITLGETRISVPVAMRLAKYFNNNPEFWLDMQMNWDLAEASKDKELTKIVKSISMFKKGEVKKPAASKKPVAKKKASKKPAAKKAAAKKPVKEAKVTKKPVKKTIKRK